MDQTQCPQRQEGYILERFEDELLLYHLDNAQTVYLNVSAALIWELCDGETSIADIIAFLQEQFPDAATQIKGDVLETVARLQEAGAMTLA